MLSDTEVAINAINTFGIESQMKKAVEELLELSMDCVRLLNGESIKPQKVAEEIADVRLVMLQLQIILSQMESKFPQLIETAYRYKVERTALVIERKMEANNNGASTATNRTVETDL
jgi:hypothetical protein